MNRQAGKDLKREANAGQDDLHLTKCYLTLLRNGMGSSFHSVMLRHGWRYGFHIM